MLDVETRRRIDTARDILVGKVPDPKSQVEQITLALIYKFMDDIDAEAEELGGQRRYFAGNFAPYGWAKLLRAGLGGHEMLNRYAEGILRMQENPELPHFFRDVFKNAYLPYREPETLREFLKVIDTFTYDHSERLGDAFEYLLSVLGSQGDAGQFRTPRHIIDFIVEVVDPKKSDRILDPACGTAGFLISAYKHILRANTGADGASTLTPDDKTRLARNIVGYDISPDMVRLSLVNMFLHGFSDPDIDEYDALTSDDRWNDYADVILANPPFMSPKGGIRPHNRFSVQSRRSEVLFVDYIAEHLTPTGRAGIIVPEGVIFQSQTAYVQLRKLLVEEYLVAVVSLPAGVFQPYSGVKTSILFLDRALARQSDSIGFFKVENDGFDLGAQRRPIGRNDLPEIANAITEFLRTVPAANPTAATGQIVARSQVLATTGCTLSAERYATGERNPSQFRVVSIGDTSLFAIESGGTPKTDVSEYWDGGVPWATLTDLPGNDWISEIRDTSRKISASGLENSSAKLLPVDTVIVSTRATIGRVGINRVPLATNQGFKNVIIRDRDEVVPEFVAMVLKALAPTMSDWATGGTFKELSKSRFSELEIPLPPLHVQQRIVTEIERYQRVIDGARAVVENYRPEIPTGPTWRKSEIGTVAGLNPPKGEASTLSGATVVSFVPMSDMTTSGIYFDPQTAKPLGEVVDGYTCFRDGDVLVAKVTPCFENGKAGVARNLVGGIGFGSTEYFVLRPNTDVLLPEWLLTCLKSSRFHDWARPQMRGTGGLQRIPKSAFANFEIPLPPLHYQQMIVEGLRKEQSIVDGNLDLIARFEAKIGAVLGQFLASGCDS